MLDWLKSHWRRVRRPRGSAAQADGFVPLGPADRGLDDHAAIERFNSWAYAAAMLNAQAVAAVPLRLYVHRRAGGRGRLLYGTRTLPPRRRGYLLGDHEQGARPSRSVLAKTAQWRDDFQEVTERHPALDLLCAVNPHTTGFELTVLRMLYLQITGNAYVHAVMDELLQRPSELWVLPSQHVRVIPGGGGGEAKGKPGSVIGGYEYAPSLDQRQRFGAREVVHWRLPSLDSSLYGRGRLEAVQSALALHEAKRTLDLSRFDNHARPDYLLVVKQGSSPEMLSRFEAAVEQKLRGVRHSGRFIAITGDVQAVPLNFPPDVIGDPDRIVEEIAAGFGVPVSKLLHNHPNRASAQTAELAWLRDTILPYCRLDEEKLNEAYLPLFGIEEDAFLAYDNPVPEDADFQLRRRLAYVQAGILTREEARAEEGLPG